MKRPLFLCIPLILALACNLGQPAGSAPATEASNQSASEPAFDAGPDAVAYYPLGSDLNDRTGQHDPIGALNAPFVPEGGLYCNGRADQEGSCQIQTPLMPSLDLNAFTISARFLVPQEWVIPNPVLVGGRNYRWLVYELGPEGVVRLGINSVNSTPCSVHYDLNVWHEATLTYDGQTAALYLDGVQGCSVPAALVTNDEKQILLTNFGNASAFRGVVRDLLISNGVHAPDPTVPQAATITFPTGELAPVDQFLLTCPSDADLAGLEALISISFEPNPSPAASTANVVCHASDGSRDLTLFQRRVYNAILVMKRMNFDQPLPWTDKQLFDWFVSAIDGVRLRQDIETSHCCDPSRVINIQTQNLTITATDRWVEPALGAGIDGFTMLLIHEARHSDGLPHTCGDSDNTIAELGAWGVQYHLSLLMAEHFTDAAFFTAGDTDYAEAARNAADDVRQLRFCLELQ